MRIDKFTTKFQQALADAQSLAIGNDQQFIEPKHLLSAVIMTAPGTLLMAKMLVPETEVPKTAGKVVMPKEEEHTNLLGAHVTPYAPMTEVYERGIRSAMVSHGADPVTAARQSLGAIWGMVQRRLEAHFGRSVAPTTERKRTNGTRPANGGSVNLERREMEHDLR